MPSIESTNTQVQGAFVKLAEGSYAIRISGTANGDSTGPVEVVIPVIARATSIENSGKVAAPAAAAAIASITLDSGTWDLEVFSFIGGTTVANLEMDNMELRFAGVAACRIINPVPGTTGATGLGSIRERFDGVGVVSINAVATATAGSIYAATIVATRVN